MSEPTAAEEREKIVEYLEALFAHDRGTDSGIHDPDLKARLRRYLFEELSEESRRVTLSHAMRYLFLSDEAIGQGYGWEDAREFGEWLDGGMR